MKSDRQAERIAAFWSAVGVAAAAPPPGAAAAGAAVVVLARGGGFFAGSIGGAGSAGTVVAAFGAANPVTVDLQEGERSAAFAFKHSTSSGLVGAINEQCAAISSSVQTRRTACNCSSCELAVCGATGTFGGAADAGAVAGVSAAAGAVLAATASTAVLHDVERRSWLRCRHSNAALPPGSTPEQLAMKSDRQDARIASRCSLVGCWAAVGCKPSEIRNRLSRIGRYIVQLSDWVCRNIAG